MKAIDFSLTDQNGKVHKLSSYRGSWVLLYFYPKDDTPGCTKEACGFRDSLNELKKHNLVVLGVSADSVTPIKNLPKNIILIFLFCLMKKKKSSKPMVLLVRKSLWGGNLRGFCELAF
jgi:Peroxiredoxin